MNITRLSSISRREGRRATSRNYDLDDLSRKRQHSKRLLHAKVVLKKGDTLVSPERFRGEHDDYGVEVAKASCESVLRKGSQSLEWYSNKKKTLVEQIKEDFDPEGKGVRLRPDLYSLQALLSRESLKYDPMILSILESLWKVVDDNKNGKLDYNEYCEFHGRLVHIFIPKCTRANSKKLLEKDWNRDTRGGKGVITKKLFFGSMFELADKWTEEISAPAYIDFLAGTLHAITKLGPEGKRVYKDISVVKREAKLRKRPVPKLPANSPWSQPSLQQKHEKKGLNRSALLADSSASKSTGALTKGRYSRSLNKKGSGNSAEEADPVQQKAEPTTRNRSNKAGKLATWKAQNSQFLDTFTRRRSLDTDMLSTAGGATGSNMKTDNLEGESGYPSNGNHPAPFERPHTSGGVVPAHFEEYYDHVMPSTLYPPPPSWWARYATEKFPVDLHRRRLLERFDKWRTAEIKLVHSYLQPCPKQCRSFSLGELPQKFNSGMKEKLPTRSNNTPANFPSRNSSICSSSDATGDMTDNVQQKLTEYLRKKGHKLPAITLSNPSQGKQSP